MMLRPITAFIGASATLVGWLFAAVVLFVPPAGALEARDEPLSIANETGAVDDEPAGENVGEPAPEDGPVEGEPGPGDTIAVPPDDLPDSGKADVPAEANKLKP